MCLYIFKYEPSKNGFSRRGIDIIFNYTEGINIYIAEKTNMPHKRNLRMTMLIDEWDTHRWKDIKQTGVSQIYYIKRNTGMKENFSSNTSIYVDQRQLQLTECRISKRWKSNGELFKRRKTKNKYDKTKLHTNLNHILTFINCITYVAHIYEWYYIKNEHFN